MLKVPDNLTDSIELADWLELSALLTDGSASFATLKDLLIQESVFEANVEDIQILSDEVAIELDSRKIACGNGYPFNIDTDIISLRSDYSDFIPYVFSLYVSFMTNVVRLDQDPYPRRMFEYLSLEVAKRFLPGEAVRFGHPRKDNMPVGFLAAVKKLTELIAEGNGSKHVPTHRAKDDGVDIVAWRHFPDRQPGKLLMFGNCASGNDWEEKLDELKPRRFCHSWIVDYPVSAEPQLRTFFIPHRLPRDDWERISQDAGIVFDRCRIAHVLADKPLDNVAIYLAWITAQLANARTV